MLTNPTEMNEDVNPPTPRPEARGMLSLPAGRQGLTLSSASLPPLKRRGLAPSNGSILWNQTFTLLVFE